MTDVQNLRASNYESQGLREVRVAVAICTYRRNEPLRTLLRALVMCAEHAKGVAVLGVVVVDDTTEGSARVITEEFVRSFDGGIHYRTGVDAGAEQGRQVAKYVIKKFL